MAKRLEAPDFETIVRDMARECVRDPQTRPVVRAGCVTECALATWLADPKLKKLPVHIWMRADACTIGSDPAPDPHLLEGARLFGEGGDLELWRAGAGFCWRFVGAQDSAPAGDELPWPGTDLNPVYCQKRAALLWGKREKGETQWFDDRVAGAQLTYPGMENAKRVQVCYDAYTQAGHVQFVWLKKLEACNG
ncbi:MAG TPA: hypothetical protein PKV20_02525 [Anaerolineae bacterium]|nr:hypothetical protein [Anaerolineae bacterium]